MADDDDLTFDVLPPLEPGGRKRLVPKWRPSPPEAEDLPKACVLCEEVRPGNDFVAISWTPPQAERGMLCVQCSRLGAATRYRGLHHADDYVMNWRDYVYFSDAATLLHLFERAIKDARTGN